MKPPHHGLRPAAGAALCAVLFFFPPVGRAADIPTGSKHVPSVVAGGLKSIGTLGDTNRLKLAIGLPLRNQAGLDVFLKQLYDPKSPNYHHYLSVEQFTAAYGPTAADYEALRAFAKANGLTETKTYANRLVLPVEAPVASIQKAFHIVIHTYKHPNPAEKNREFYAPDTEPTLNLSVPVLHIAGLDNYELPHPAGLSTSS